MHKAAKVLQHGMGIVWPNHRSLTNVPCEFRNVFWTNLELKTMQWGGGGGWGGGILIKYYQSTLQTMTRFIE